MNRSVVVVSKPLQYFNATNIEISGRKVCLIVNNFSNAKTIFNNIKTHSLYWDEVFFFETLKNAYKWVLDNKKDIDNLFIDSDYGAKKYVILDNIRNVDIFVYEEGIGNYRKKLRERNVKGYFKENFYRIVGHKDYLGGYKYTKGIYLYDKNHFLDVHPHCQKKLYDFKVPFLEHLDMFQDKDIFFDENAQYIISKVRNKKVLLYLTSWNIYSDIDNVLNGYPDYVKIVKPHPHIKNFDKSFVGFDYIIGGSNLIEIFINNLLKISEEVVILHHGTSSLMYFSDSKKVKPILLNKL